MTSLKKQSIVVSFIINKKEMIFWHEEIIWKKILGLKNYFKK